MRLKLFFFMLAVFLVIQTSKKIEACSIAIEDYIYPRYDMENVPTNGFVAFYWEPENVLLTNEEGETVDLISFEGDHPLRYISSRAGIYKTVVDLEPETHYSLRARLGGRDLELEFTTGIGRDDLPPTMASGIEVGIDFHEEGEALWINFGGGTCGPGEYLASDIDEDQLSYLEGFGQVSPLAAHYHFDTHLSPITDQAYVTVSLFKEREGGEIEHISTALVKDSETIPHLMFRLDDVSESGSEIFQVQIEDIFGNQMKKEFTITSKLNGDNSTATVAVQEDDPPPPPPPPEPAESERFGGCSLIRK